MIAYVALLRGINVGGNNVIKMSDLKAAFEALDLSAVATYIASGNVLFETGEKDAAALTRRIETALSARFGYDSKIVLRSRAQMKAVVAGAPRGFGSRPALRRYDAIFLKEPLTAREALESITIAEGVDEAHAGKGVLYFSRLIAQAARSRLGRVVMLPVYKRMTIRNWNTTTKLEAMLRARAGR
jgi:uncharacterized protein (DUF1697 family)